MGGGDKVEEPNSTRSVWNHIEDYGTFPPDEELPHPEPDSRPIGPLPRVQRTRWNSRNGDRRWVPGATPSDADPSERGQVPVSTPSSNTGPSAAPPPYRR